MLVPYLQSCHADAEIITISWSNYSALVNEHKDSHSMCSQTLFTDLSPVIASQSQSHSETGDLVLVHEMIPSMKH